MDGAAVGGSVQGAIRFEIATVGVMRLAAMPRELNARPRLSPVDLLDGRARLLQLGLDLIDVGQDLAAVLKRQAHERYRVGVVARVAKRDRGPIDLDRLGPFNGRVADAPARPDRERPTND